MTVTIHSYGIYCFKIYYISGIIRYVNSTTFFELCVYDDGREVVKVFHCWNLEGYANVVETEINGEVEHVSAERATLNPY